MIASNQHGMQDERSAKEYLVDRFLSLAGSARDRKYAAFCCAMARFVLDDFADELNEAARRDETVKLPHNLPLSLDYVKIQLVESQIDRKFGGDQQ